MSPKRASLKGLGRAPDCPACQTRAWAFRRIARCPSATLRRTIGALWTGCTAASASCQAVRPIPIVERATGAWIAPVARSTMGIGLTAWQDALAAVQPVQSAPIVRRSVALGHLAILRNAHALVWQAGQSGALPRPFSDALLGDIHQLARAHQTALSQIDSRGLGSTRVDQAVMLKLGSAVRQLTGPSDT